MVGIGNQVSAVTRQDISIDKDISYILMNSRGSTAKRQLASLHEQTDTALSELAFAHQHRGTTCKQVTSPTGVEV